MISQILVLKLPKRDCYRVEICYADRCLIPGERYCQERTNTKRLESPEFFFFPNDLIREITPWITIQLKTPYGVTYTENMISQGENGNCQYCSGLN